MPSRRACFGTCSLACSASGQTAAGSSGSLGPQVDLAHRFAEALPHGCDEL